MPIRLAISAVALAVAAIEPAFAPVGSGPHASFLAGIAHPFSGLDHMLAMLAVGLWAAMLGGRAVWAVPASFVATMIAGFGLALAGISLPFVEPAILASVMVLGLLVAASVRVPVAGGPALVAVFALFHGQAHGSELGLADRAPYLLGFAAATILLHGAGLALGRLVVPAAGSGDRIGGLAVRALGAGIAAIGAGLGTGLV